MVNANGTSNTPPPSPPKYPIIDEDENHDDNSTDFITSKTYKDGSRTSETRHEIAEVDGDGNVIRMGTAFSSGSTNDSNLW
jgi:hypothetical protein